MTKTENPSKDAVVGAVAERLGRDSDGAKLAPLLFLCCALLPELFRSSSSSNCLSQTQRRCFL